MTPSDDATIDQARELSSLLAELVRRFGLQDEQQVCCYDISLSEYRALQVADEYGTPAMHDFVEALGVTKSGATRIVDRLEQKGYAQRERDARDGRICCVRLTTPARNLLAQIESEAVARMRDVLAGIDASQRDDILAALRTLHRATRRANGVTLV